jgi:hypothetical protein
MSQAMSVPPRNRRQQAKMVGVVVFDETTFPKNKTIRQLREENRVVRDRGEYCNFSDPLDDESE